MARRKIRFEDKEYIIDEADDKEEVFDKIFKKLEKLEETEDSGDGD